MEGYTATIVNCTRELSPRDKIRIKDTTNAIALDDLTQKEGKVVISYGFHAELAIHNEHSDNKDYTKYVLVDQAGTKYVTGSPSFITALEEIVKEMLAAGETDFSIEVYRLPSKNYKGKEFMTCSIV